MGNTLKQWSKERKPYYQDFGLILDAGAVAAGASVWSNYIENLGWANSYVFMSSCDQLYDIQIMRKDSSGQADFGNNFSIGNTAVVAGAFRPQVCSLINGITSAFFGYGVRFAIKNNGAVPTTFAKLKIQCGGV